jgi:hypothetical protein
MKKQRVMIIISKRADMVETDVEDDDVVQGKLEGYP